MLWVDAVCIDQINHEEKTQQIRLLPHIFRMANSTLACLNETPDAMVAIEMLMQIRAKKIIEHESLNEALSRSKVGQHDPDSTAEQPLVSHMTVNMSSDGRNATEVQAQAAARVQWPDGLPAIPSSWSKDSIPPTNDAGWSSIKSFFETMWFRRAWILQEVVIPTCVMLVCGKWCVDWSVMHQAVEIIDREIDILTDHHPNLIDLRKSWQPFLYLAERREYEARSERISLITMLENSRNLKSTLMRDRFFALLGLAHDGNEPDFEPDYDSALSTIVLRFSKVFIRQGRALQLLYRAGFDSFHSPFPSWIPNWTVERSEYLHERSTPGVSFSASGSLDLELHGVRSGTSELIVDGCFVDTICTVSRSANIESQWSEYFTEVDTLVAEAKLRTTRISRKDLRWKVPIACGTSSQALNVDMRTLGLSYEVFRQYLEAQTEIPEELTTQSTIGLPISDLRERSAVYQHALRGTFHGWKCILTSKGHIGIAPGTVAVGDAVVLLLKGSVPFLLRHHTNSNQEAYRLVGPAYVDGIMFGEEAKLVKKHRFHLF
jgi:hypothetical protein